MLTACNHPRTYGLKERQAPGLCQLMTSLSFAIGQDRLSWEKRFQIKNGNAFDSMRYSSGESS